MRRNRQEWDWPPRRQRQARHYDVLDAFRVDETGWNSPAVTRAVGVYWVGVKLVVKMVFGAVLGAVLIGCAWLFATILYS